MATSICLYSLQVSQAFVRSGGRLGVWGQSSSKPMTRFNVCDDDYVSQPAMRMLPNLQKDRLRQIACKATADSASLDAEQSSLPVSDEEREGWEKRKTESEANGAPIGNWQWTLNWDHITPSLIVGSCPRSSSDVDRLVDEAGVTAILNLQSDVCFEALQIPAEEIRERALERGVLWERVPTFDFDKGDQALMLPEGVRMLALLLARGQTVYCHCTAGINRAPLAALGFLTFVEGASLDDALAQVKGARGVANPYLECWKEVQRRLLEGRHEELTALAKDIYRERCEGGLHGNASTDWLSAQSKAVVRSFQRYLQVDMLAIEMESALAKRRSLAELAPLQAKVRAAEQELAGGQGELAAGSERMSSLQAQVSEAQRQVADSQGLLSGSQAQLAAAQQKLADSQAQLSATQADLAAALRELAALRTGSVQTEAGLAGEPEAEAEAEAGGEGGEADQVEDCEAEAALLDVADDLECDVVTRTCTSAGGALDEEGEAEKEPPAVLAEEPAATAKGAPGSNGAAVPAETTKASQASPI